MSTRDGINTKDWDVVHTLVVNLINASEAEEDSCRRRLLDYLDELEAKYGCLPSILATRADFVRDEAEKESLLLRAYSLARQLEEAFDTLEIAHSLAEFYVEEHVVQVDADYWLGRLREHLKAITNPSMEKEYRRLRKKEKLAAWQKRDVT